MVKRPGRVPVVPRARSGAWPLVEIAGYSFGAMEAARPLRCCGATSGVLESIPSAGSRTSSSASPPIPLPGSPSCCRTTGHPPWHDFQTSNSHEPGSGRWPSLVILRRLRCWFIDPAAEISKKRSGSRTLCVFKPHCRDPRVQTIEANLSTSSGSWTPREPDTVSLVVLMSSGRPIP